MRESAGPSAPPPSPAPPPGKPERQAASGPWAAMSRATPGAGPRAPAPPGTAPPGTAPPLPGPVRTKGPEPDEARCDSGIDSLRSLRSLPGAAAPPPPPDPPGDRHPAGDKDGDGDGDGERTDSAYGSASLTAALPPGLSPQQVEALTYVSEDGDTLLHLAVIHVAPAVLLCCLALLPQEALDIQNDLFQTALHLAVHLDQPGTVRALLQKGASRLLQDGRGDTALHVACQHQRLDCARCLLEDTPEPGRGPPRPQDLQLQNWQGLACLHIATLQRNCQLVGLLLKNGANIDTQEGTSGKTALHLAVESQEAGLVRFLLGRGARVDARMFNGCTPLHLAVGRRQPGIASSLCQAGADTLLRNVEDETPQDLADGHGDLLQLLPFDDLKISGKPLICAD
ncbi:NF-kappa-B inhibitor epsilon [Tachyglossus aculeatus]|uniref:NF-kappa-B inhibitor epsilon n=1 Tax=Tachyglossus aculeatus TaxID=9261 RepID=UPI0018F40E88|nr:NF-kappa-B inhibitor epsilon [Tachyglossus aculeatus]